MKTTLGYMATYPGPITENYVYLDTAINEIFANTSGYYGNVIIL